jgi:hypothetical protein
MFVLLLAASASGAVATGDALQCVAGSSCAGVVARIDPQGAFIAGAIRDLLGRPVSANEEAGWRSSLGGGETREAMAASIETGTEYRNRLVAGLYQRFLRRSPSASDQALWLGQLQAGTADEDVIANLVGSTEYYGLAGNSNSGFISMAYSDLLGRSPSAPDQTFWTTFLASHSRQEMVESLLESTEYRNRLVTALYQQFLHRSADPASQSFWVSQLQSGAADEDVIAFLVGSQEYFDRDPRWTATIDWGDHASSPGTISANEVSASHVYAQAGAFPVTVVLSDDRGLSVSVDATASVSAAGRVPPPGPSRLTLRGVKLDRRHGTATVSVSLPGPGTLRSGGKWITVRALGGGKARLSGVSVTVGSPTTVKLLVSAKGNAKRKLDRTGVDKVRLALTFTPNGGSPIDQIDPIRLRKAR